MLVKRQHVRQVTMLVATVLFAVFGFGIQRQGESQYSRRETFQEQLKLVRKGMTELEVRAILGDADLTHQSTMERPMSRNAHCTWFYGTSPRYRIPTLGFVEFTDEGIVERVFGDEGAVIEDGLFDEAEIRHYFDVMANGEFGGKGGPFETMLAVNELRSLGQASVFSLYREYLRVFEDEPMDLTPYFLLLYLHRPREGAEGFESQLPVPSVGGFEPIPEKRFRPLLAPRYPVHLLDGVPLVLVQGVFGTGTTSGALEGLLERLENSSEWDNERISVNFKPIKELTRDLHNFLREYSDYFADSPGSVNRMYDKLEWQIDQYAQARDFFFFCLSLQCRL